jgi:hypothetical protein
LDNKEIARLSVVAMGAIAVLDDEETPANWHTGVSAHQRIWERLLVLVPDQKTQRVCSGSSTPTLTTTVRHRRSKHQL